MIRQTLLSILFVLGQGEGQSDEALSIGAYHIKTVFERFDWKTDHYCWANDESRIFFLDRKKGYDLCEYVFEDDQVHVLIETFSRRPGKLSVTPDDRQLIFYTEDRARGNSFKVIALETLEVRSLTARVFNSGIIAPNGEFILAWGRPTDKGVRSPALLRIPLALEAAGTKVLFQTANRAEIRREDRIAFSHDGKLIALTYREKSNNLNEPGRVVLARLNEAGMTGTIEMKGPITPAGLAFAEADRLLISGKWEKEGNAIASIKASRAIERRRATEIDWLWKKGSQAHIAVSPGGRYVAVAFHKLRSRHLQTSTGVCRSGADTRTVSITSGWDRGWVGWSPKSGFLISCVGTRREGPRYEVFSLPEVEIGWKIRSFERSDIQGG